MPRAKLIECSRYESAQAILAILCCATMAGCSPAAEPVFSGDETRAKVSVSQPTISGLSEHPVVGLLGLQLGTVTEIRATVIAGSALHMKAYAGSYLLRVTEVAGRPIEKPFNIEFTVPAFVNVKLARDSFQLYELETGNKIGRLDSNQITEIEKGYVGKEMRLVVYETGGYSGIPRDLPHDVPSWQDHSFIFSTSLVVLAESP